MYVKSIITICMVFYSILAIPQNENKIINGVSKENFRWGDDIGNGAGLSESNFAFAFHNMETILKNILSNSEAGLSHLELDLTSKIIQSLKDEYNKNSRVYFVNKNQYPFSDKPECYNKVACTGLKVGSFIFVNRSILEKRERAQNYIYLPEASSIMAHEFGHHHGITSEEFLLNYGAKVRRLMSQNNNSMINRWRKNLHIYSQYQNFTDLKKSFIALSDEKAEVHLNLSKELTKNFKCPGDNDIYLGHKILQMIWDTDVTNRTWLVRYDVAQYCERDDVVASYEAERLLIIPVFTYADNRLNLTGYIPEYISCNYGSGNCFNK